MKEETKLPIHFFTIVLNGDPFIQVHIETLKRLPFKWHWHIVEGVAALTHDTSWSLDSGGCVPETLHKKGLSNDGTTRYLDELKEKYPENVSIYRKEEGLFWDGKREMVNAPLPEIQEACLLWQLDVDEFWTAEQFAKVRELFLHSPDKQVAYYYCHYFVGEYLVIASRNQYGNYETHEWLRTWRFEPGYYWRRHEPPILCNENHQELGATEGTRFSHTETEAAGLVFQHYAYFLEKQLTFKESYYGYRNAVYQWKALQANEYFPVKLKDYFDWVKDEAVVSTVAGLNIQPLVSFQDEQLKRNEIEQQEAGLERHYVLTVNSLERVIQNQSQKKNVSQRKKILVVSHERSGTHLLLNTIGMNFIPYATDIFSLLGTAQELQQIFEVFEGVAERRLFKSHHHFDFFRPFFDELIKHFHVFYILRDGRDVLNSCLHYFKTAPKEIFPQPENIKELLETKPTDYAFHATYHLTNPENMIARWTNHVESWLAVQKSVCVVRYENILYDFERVIQDIARHLQLSEPRHLVKPKLSDMTVFPRKGISGDWENYFSKEDLQAFNACARTCMESVGYY